MRWKKSDLAWLALALGVHFALLFLPLRHWQNRAEPGQAIAVQLVSYLRSVETPIAPKPQPPPAMGQRPNAPPPPIREPGSASAAAKSSQPEPDVPDQSAATEGVEGISTARLVDLVSRMSFTAAETLAHRQLGSTAYSKQAPSWRTGERAGAFTPEHNRFEGKMAPAEIELVDRWQAADGSQNVVINTPGGETLCGRAEGWDPMDPLVEHLMMFRRCGGGGTRTFTMDKRELP